MHEHLSSRIRRDEAGFTLVELLVVVIILGILAAIVVFSVRGISDRSQETACATDVNMLRSAQEANFAQNGTWAPSETQLMSAGFLATESKYYSVTTVGATVQNPYSIVLDPAVPVADQPCTSP